MLAGVLTECLDVDTVKRRTMEVITAEIELAPEVTPCLAEVVDEAWYAHGTWPTRYPWGDTDDTFVGQLHATMMGCVDEVTAELYESQRASPRAVRCLDDASGALRAELEPNSGTMA